MNSDSEGSDYSFSMVNLVKLMPEWNWQEFNRIMNQVGTKQVELVPGMVLGSDWDQQINKPSACRDALTLLMDSYIVTSIQSLTYGLNINLADALYTNNDVERRFRSLAQLGNLLGCNVFVLGSPGQKTLKGDQSNCKNLKHMFTENCAWMASIIGPSGILSLEHNTLAQGAEFCNTLSDIVDVVNQLRQLGVGNVGINLDTKCLIQEFGKDFNLAKVLVDYQLQPIVTSIQVSFDFLTRSSSQAQVEDERMLLQLGSEQCCPISLEEFGLVNAQLNSFISAWQTAQSIQPPF